MVGGRWPWGECYTNSTRPLEVSLLGVDDEGVECVLEWHRNRIGGLSAHTWSYGRIDHTVARVRDVNSRRLDPCSISISQSARHHCHYKHDVSFTGKQ
eukprot:6444430-Amphidinium_carterae.1